jgi:hypothetical protein
VLAAVLDRAAPLTTAGEGAGRGEEDRLPPPVLLGCGTGRREEMSDSRVSRVATALYMPPV